MARYQRALQTPSFAESYAPAINAYIEREGFKQTQYKGQALWKKGVGMLTAPQYLSVQYQGNTIYIEAFIRNAILPGVYFGEYGIDGVYLAIPKALLRDRVAAVERYIMGLWQPQNQPQNMSQQQSQYYAQR